MTGVANKFMGGSREGPGTGGQEVAIGFFTNAGTDPLEKQLGPMASRGRSVRPSVKTVMTKNVVRRFWIRARS